MATRDNAHTPSYHEQLQQIEPYAFEQFVADLWTRQGWETKVSQQSNDRGIDIIATNDQPIPQKHVLQAKRYDSGNKVGSQAIQQYSSLRQQEPGTDTVVIVTTSGYTQQARELADRLNVKLVNGQDLSRLIHQLNADSLVSEYAIEAQSDQQSNTVSNKTHSSSSETPENTIGDEMGTGEALIAATRLLLILGVLAYMAFYIFTHVPL